MFVFKITQFYSFQSILAVEYRRETGDIYCMYYAWLILDIYFGSTIFTGPHHISLIYFAQNIVRERIMYSHIKLNTKAQNIYACKIKTQWYTQFSLWTKDFDIHKKACENGLIPTTTHRHTRIIIHALELKTWPRKTPFRSDSIPGQRWPRNRSTCRGIWSRAGTSWPHYLSSLQKADHILGHFWPVSGSDPDGLFYLSSLYVDPGVFNWRPSGSQRNIFEQQ